MMNRIYIFIIFLLELTRGRVYYYVFVEKCFVSDSDFSSLRIRYYCSRDDDFFLYYTLYDVRVYIYIYEREFK